MWVLDSHRKKIVQRNISYVPGLYKIFDEIMVNASDNKQRDPTMDTIKITIDQVFCCIFWAYAEYFCVCMLISACLLLCHASRDLLSVLTYFLPPSP